AETAVDEARGLHHLAGVLAIFGHVLARFLQHRPEHHAAVPLRMGLQQALVGDESADDVLGEVHTVDPIDELLRTPAQHLALGPFYRGAGGATLEFANIDRDRIPTHPPR